MKNKEKSFMLKFGYTINFKKYLSENLFRTFILTLLLFVSIPNLHAQRGFFDAPYTRYEADLATLSNGAVVTTKSYKQSDLQSEASDQICVNMPSVNATIAFTITTAADGLVIRYSVPMGSTATIGVYNGSTRLTGLNLTSKWSWEHLWDNGNPNNNGVVNKNYKKRFDEIRYKLPSQISANGTLRLVNESGSPTIDFIEMEPIPAAVTAPAGSVTYTGNGSDLQTFINNNGGKTIFIPAGDYSVTTQLYFGVANTKFQGAGMWYSHINFTTIAPGKGGLCSNATGVSFADLYLTTDNNSRSNSYKGLNGVYTPGTTIRNLWIEHFECGAWIANYGGTGPANADGFTMSYCRFRDNYADGSNLCKGTSNAIVEHCDYRNNGDDDMGIWSANNQECVNNTFRYNTSENCWRASGVAIYGGQNNKAYNILIKDNLEVGIRINNVFAGSPFNATGLHELHDITIISCGTFNDLFNNKVGAIDLVCSNVAGTRVQNVKFYNIDIIDSKNDAIFFSKQSGDGFYNFTFENITINGTGKEYPNNNFNNTNTGRGYFVLFAGAPSGNGTYCAMTYTNRGGNATIDENKAAIGAFSWTATTGCNLAIPVTGVSITPTTKSIAVGETFTVVGTVTPANATKPTVTYSIVAGGETFVSVGAASGLVTGLAAGNAIVRVTSADGGKTADCAVTVYNIAVTGATITPTTKTIGIGETFSVVGSVVPSNATNKGMTYSIISGSSFASVNSTTGLVTGIAAGTATVRVTTSDGAKTADCVIIVEDFPVTGISISPTSESIGINKTFSIIPTILPSNAGNKTVIYSVVNGNSNVSVNPTTGVVTGLTVGTATVRATSTDGGKTADCIVTVYDSPTCVAPAIVYTTTSPIIDQIIDSVWASAPSKNITISTRDTIQPGFSAVWRSLYTKSNLYFLVEVTKKGTLYNRNGNNWWNDDAVEIFIDGDNSKDSIFDGQNDFQYGFRYNDGTIIHIGGTNPINSTNGIIYKLYSTSVGYNLEVSIPWTTLNTTPMNGNKIGLEVGVDVSSGTTRLTQMMTFDSTGLAYKNPKLFGSVDLSQCSYYSSATVTLGNLTAIYDGTPKSATATTSPTGLPIVITYDGSTTAPTNVGTYSVVATIDNPWYQGSSTGTLIINKASGINSIIEKNISIFSNKGIITINGIEVGKNISVYNMLGSIVFNKKANDNIEYISSLENGVYLVYIEGQARAQKVVVVK